MTFFIQSCPACARRFRLPLQALGQSVECQFCFSVFPATDETEDCGEATDRIDEWAREQAEKSMNHSDAADQNRSQENWEETENRINSSTVGIDFAGYDGPDHDLVTDELTGAEGVGDLHQHFSSKVNSPHSCRPR